MLIHQSSRLKSNDPARKTAKLKQNEKKVNTAEKKTFFFKKNILKKLESTLCAEKHSCKETLNRCQLKVVINLC